MRTQTSRRSTYDLIHNVQVKKQILLYRNTLGIELQVFYPSDSQSVYSSRSQDYSYDSEPNFTSCEAILNIHGLNYGKYADSISSLFRDNKPALYIVDNFDEFKVFSKIRLDSQFNHDEYIINEVVNFMDTNKQIAYAICYLTPYTNHNVKSELVEIDDTTPFKDKKLKEEEIENQIPNIYNVNWKTNTLDDE